MRLLFDANFSPRIVRALRALLDDVVLEHSTEHLPQEATDPQVFQLCTDQQAVLITKDRKIMKKPHEVAAYRQSGIGAFIFTGTAQRRLLEEARFVLDVIEDVLLQAGRIAPPYVYRITDKKKLERLG